MATEPTDRDIMQAALLRRWYEQNLHRGRNETRVGADEFMLALLRVAGNILALSDEELMAFLRADATQADPQQDVDALERINIPKVN